MPKIEKQNALPKTFSENLSQLISREKKKDERVPFHIKLMNRSIGYFGSLPFLWLNVIFFVVWIGLNVVPQFFGKPFDPYPFQLLTLAVSLEAIVLTIIILVAQNNLQMDSDERAQLDLHINLLAESEATLILRKLERLENHFGLIVDPEEKKRVKDLIEDTHPEKLAEFIHETFSPEKAK